MKNVAFFHRKQINFHFYIKEICLKNYFFREILHVFLDVKMNKNIKKMIFTNEWFKFFLNKNKTPFFNSSTGVLILIFKKKRRFYSRKKGGWMENWAAHFVQNQAFLKIFEFFGKPL